MIGVNQQMEEESSVEMKGFLKAEKYAAVLSELKSSVQVRFSSPAFARDSFPPVPEMAAWPL